MPVIFIIQQARVSKVGLLSQNPEDQLFFFFTHFSLKKTGIELGKKNSLTKTFRGGKKKMNEFDFLKCQLLIFLKLYLNNPRS